MKIRIIKKSPVQIRRDQNLAWEDYVYPHGVTLEVVRLGDMGETVTVVTEDGKEIRGLFRENFVFSR